MTTELLIEISTLALLVEGDAASPKAVRNFSIFQPSPSLWRATFRQRSGALLVSQFQSAPSLWRATAVIYAIAASCEGFQSAPSLWRATWSCGRTHSKLLHFNPRPPCGGRPPTTAASSVRVKFQSAPSLWRATVSAAGRAVDIAISIRALLVEGDAASC